MSRRILITAAGSGPSSNLMRSLLHGDPDATVLGCHSDRFILKKSPAQRNFMVAPLETREGRAALEQVVEVAQVDLVIPGNDRDAHTLASLRRRQRSSARTFLPALKTIELCQDKCALSLFLRSQGVAAPRTHALSDRESVARAWASLDAPELAWCRIRRGFASRGATKVRDVEQTWAWISYWHAMRGVPVEDFTLSEYLPGRSSASRDLVEGRLADQMCEPLVPERDTHQRHGVDAPWQTVWEPAAIATGSRAALQSIHGGRVFGIDLKENMALRHHRDQRQALQVTNIRLRRPPLWRHLSPALGGIGIGIKYDHGGSTTGPRPRALPTVLCDALFEGIERPQAAQIRA
jgi:carbamoyl-phosphate synthase large subunit